MTLSIINIAVTFNQNVALLHHCSATVVCLQEAARTPVKLHNFNIIENNTTFSNKSIVISVKQDILMPNIYLHPSARITYVKMEGLYLI